MRASIVWLMAVACGGASRPQPQAKPAVSDNHHTTSSAVEPITAAVIAADHIKVISLAPTAITVKRDVKLPTAPDEARWLDHEHIIAVDAKGQAYLVTGDGFAAYK